MNKIEKQRLRDLRKRYGQRWKKPFQNTGWFSLREKGIRSSFLLRIAEKAKNVKKPSKKQKNEFIKDKGMAS